MTSALAGVAVLLPTLTEVVDPRELGANRRVADDAAVDVDLDEPLSIVSAPAPSPASAPERAIPTEQELVRRVMIELERQIDLMLEYRLREMLAPLLTRLADTLVRDTRAELASTLRDVVARAVAIELARQPGERPER